MNPLHPNPPRLDAIPPGTETCGCCIGVERDTPLEIDNRPGLGAIAYRIGGYTQFRASLHAGLSLAEFAPLGSLHTRDDNDFTIGLLDAFACAADVLTFYQERIANESYVRTATERLSLEQLGRLIGYRLRPGLAAETWLAFTLETPPAPPPNIKPEPGTFVSGVPAELTLEPGLSVRSIPGPNEKPQVFETVESLLARPEWNAMRPWLNDALHPVRGDQATYLHGVRNGLKPGDALLLLGDEYLANVNDDRWDFRIIERVELQSDHDRTLVTWRRPLGSLAPFGTTGQRPQAFALRKRASVYGHNAPAWGSMSDVFRTTYVAAFGGSVDVKLGWPSFVISKGGTTSSGGHVDLDAVYVEAAPGGYAVLAKGGFNYPNEPAPSGTYVELYNITNAAEASREEFALSGKVTRLQLTGENYSLFASAVRETSVFVQSEPLAFAQYPVDATVAGARVPVAVSPRGLDPGRRVLIRGALASDGSDLVHAATIVAVHALANAQRCELEIAPPLSAPLARRSVTVYGNIALASQGETVAQILGAGDASAPFQRFELKQAPLTYRAASNELGAAGELTVRVDEVAWRERDTLYAAQAHERAFTLETDEQGRNFVRFGDGIRGARLPSGSNNVRASFRKGLGAEGNVKADSLTQLTSRPLGLKAVSNPLPAEGGTDPQDVSVARDSMPLVTRTLGRAVSLLDYEDFARAFSGVAKAQAQVLRLTTGPTIVVTIAGPNGAVISASNPVWKNLRDALAANGDPHVAVRLLAHDPSTFRVGLTFRRDPAYESKAVRAAIEAALRAHFSFDARELGQPVQQSDVIAVAQRVPGVVAIDLDFLYGGTQPAAQTVRSHQTRLLAVRTSLDNGVLVPAELLTLHPEPFERLEEMT